MVCEERQAGRRQRVEVQLERGREREREPLMMAQMCVYVCTLAFVSASVGERREEREGGRHGQEPEIKVDDTGW